jgi:hypothetical protein
LTEISEVLTASIIRALMMEAVSTSETPIKFYQTIHDKLSQKTVISMSLVNPLLFVVYLMTIFKNSSCIMWNKSVISEL